MSTPLPAPMQRLPIYILPTPRSRAHRRTFRTRWRRALPALLLATLIVGAFAAMSAQREPELAPIAVEARD
jgi:hypothetical protein